MTEIFIYYITIVIAWILFFINSKLKHIIDLLEVSNKLKRQELIYYDERREKV
jgi:hypothetical protein